MASLFLVSVVFSALFFGFGYSMGKGATVSANGAGGSSPAVVVLGQRAASKSPAQAEATDSSETPASPIPAAASEAHPTAGGLYFLQVAAVTKQEDAEPWCQLCAKRTTRSLPPTEGPLTSCFMCRLAPSAIKKDVEGLRAKLVAAGYNPIVKKQA